VPCKFPRSKVMRPSRSIIGEVGELGIGVRESPVEPLDEGGRVHFPLADLARRHRGQRRDGGHRLAGSSRGLSGGHCLGCSHRLGTRHSHSGWRRARDRGRSLRVATGGHQTAQSGDKHNDEGEYRDEEPLIDPAAG
jgi:hypothetical protein